MAKTAARLLSKTWRNQTASVVVAVVEVQTQSQGTRYVTVIRDPGSYVPEQVRGRCGTQDGTTAGTVLGTSSRCPWDTSGASQADR
jgi:hypothetical protein